MTEERSHTSRWAAAGLVLLVLLVGAYIGGYFALSDRVEVLGLGNGPQPRSFERRYPHPG
jgi:hypothetical protein